MSWTRGQSYLLETAQPGRVTGAEPGGLPWRSSAGTTRGPHHLPRGQRGWQEASSTSSTYPPSTAQIHTPRPTLAFEGKSWARPTLKPQFSKPL